MRITVYDAEYDAEEFENVKDAQVIELGILIIIDEDDKLVKMYGPMAWREVDFDRGE